MNKVEYIVIHHSATDRLTTTFNGVRNYHLSLGWDDIGYHYFIAGNGAIIKGREEYTNGAHCRSNRMNHRSIGICLAGDFTKEKPSENQIKSLISLIARIQKHYNMPNEKVLGHKDVDGARTPCPGCLIDFIKEYKKKPKQKEELDGDLISKKIAKKEMGEFLKLANKGNIQAKLDLIMHNQRILNDNFHAPQNNLKT